MSLPFHIADRFYDDLPRGVHDFSSDDLRAVLVDGDVSADMLTIDDVSEVAEGTGYTARGESITNTITTRSGNALVEAESATWQAKTGDVGPFNNILLFNNSHVDKPIIGWWSYQISKIIPHGSARRIAFDDGLLSFLVDNVEGRVTWPYVRQMTWLNGEPVAPVAYPLIPDAEPSVVLADQAAVEAYVLSRYPEATSVGLNETTGQLTITATKLITVMDLLVTESGLTPSALDIIVWQSLGDGQYRGYSTVNSDIEYSLIVTGPANLNGTTNFSVLTGGTETTFTMSLVSGLASFAGHPQSVLNSFLNVYDFDHIDSQVVEKSGTLTPAGVVVGNATFDHGGVVESPAGTWKPTAPDNNGAVMLEWEEDVSAASIGITPSISVYDPLNFAGHMTYQLGVKRIGYDQWISVNGNIYTDAEVVF